MMSRLHVCDLGDYFTCFSGSWLEECFSLSVAYRCFFSFPCSRAQILGRPRSLGFGVSETTDGELIDARMGVRDEKNGEM